MNINDLKPASMLAKKLGVKAIIYGPPGTGKTPLVGTAPNPVLLSIEPGMLSMRNSNVPTFEAPTKAKIDEFFKWFEYSNESKKFDTLAIDSTSGMCNVCLEESKKSHGLQQYGEMADYVFPYMQRMYVMPNKHMYLIAKEEFSDGVKRPAYPGKFLPKEMPHLFDCVLRLAKIIGIPGAPPGEQLAFQCNGSVDVIARNRTGVLDTFEPPDFGHIVRKAMT